MNGLNERHNIEPTTTAKEQAALGSIDQTQSASTTLPPAYPRIFIALPRKHKPEGLQTRQVIPQKFIYCEKPEGKSSRLLEGTQARNRSYSHEPLPSRLISLMVLVATVFAAIGLLRMMITGLDLPTQSGNLKKLSIARVPGSGPSPLDALQSEYQNALTREMVPKNDTALANISQPEGEKYYAGVKKIKVSANDFSSNVRNGIHNLKLRIFNGTRHTLDRVTIEVDFLQKNGHVIRSEYYSALGLAPQHFRTIEVPEGMPGVKIQYRISEVRTRRFSTMLQRI